MLPAVLAVAGLAQAGIGAYQTFTANKRRKEAQADYEQSLRDFRSQDVSNLYTNLENTMEDLTVNQEAARFQMQQQAQGQANILGSLRGAAGASGAASLAQTLANQQAQSARAASIDIGRQEQANQMAAAGQAARLQAMERGGAAQARQLKSGLLDTELAMSMNMLTGARSDIAAGMQTMAGGVGNIAAGLGEMDFSKKPE